LAHERAHLAGRHHRLLATARIIGQVLPFLPLMRDADAQVARLMELHADDAALRASDPRSLATALAVLATGASPEPALAAAATDAVQRIHRLLGRPNSWAGCTGSCASHRSHARAGPGCCWPWHRPRRLALGRVPAT
jgi:Zn-dependent protease with chaperone function